MHGRTVARDPLVRPSKPTAFPLTRRKSMSAFRPRREKTPSQRYCLRTFSRVHCRRSPFPTANGWPMTSTEPRIPEPSSTGTVDFRGHQTWYRVTGDLDPESPQAPPGRAPRRPGRGAQLLPDDGQPRPGRPGGHPLRPARLRPQHPPARTPTPPSGRVELFVEEVRAVVTALGIGDRFHLLGQSWGGMLGPEFVLADPHGVQSLTICDSPASMPLWLEAAGDPAQPAARSRCRRR